MTTIFVIVICHIYADIIAMGISFFSFRFIYFIINSIVHAKMQIKMQTLCEWMQMGNEPVRSRMNPISGPKIMTKIALPTMCQPNAAGSFSSDEYSLTVKVKLLSAMPRKNPAMQSQAIIEDISVCSAKTDKKYYWSVFHNDCHIEFYSLDLVIATNRIDTMNTNRFDTFVLSQIGGTIIRARISVRADTLKQ